MILGDDGCFEDGTVVPSTVIGFKKENVVTQVKTESTDGYNVEYERVSDRKLNMLELGHLNKFGVIPCVIFRRSGVLTCILMTSLPVKKLCSRSSSRRVIWWMSLAQPLEKGSKLHADPGGRLKNVEVLEGLFFLTSPPS
ncbi:50S ribosomal protein L3, chloroplastic-like isoform X3 [Spinacia oleracea]|uniref:50S ribosomal protein L3, chloroplastic-like isoform X3 n=1 Tax=Spinacia oleracea TaxID=3562 RepID=A0ABM3QSX5_SPIOL|nr:50S ribosomal protein L3, chloroplastic-like isoform X3 [Spinacia oleracea]